LVLSLAPCGMAQPPTYIVGVEELPYLDQRAHLNDYVLRHIVVPFIHRGQNRHDTSKDDMLALRHKLGNQPSFTPL
jgi:hypothetical protein